MDPAQPLKIKGPMKKSVKDRVDDFKRLVNGRPARQYGRKKLKGKWRKKKRERITTTVNLSPKHYSLITKLAEQKDECVSTIMRQLLIKGVYEALGMQETRHKPKV